MRTALVALFCAFAVAGCDSTLENENSLSRTGAEKDQNVATITQKRMAVEARKGQSTRSEISTDSMNARIRQKLGKLACYSKNGNLLRIKSYPHAQVSSRTEEFHFRDGEVIFAYIEVDGMHGEGNDVHTKGKEFYCNDGQFVAIRNMSGDSERSVRNSDSQSFRPKRSSIRNCTSPRPSCTARCACRSLASAVPGR